MEQEKQKILETTEKLDDSSCSRLKILLEDDSTERSEGTMIGDKAPQFIANSTIGEIKLSDFAGAWLVLFSHPGDFTPVCTTEFIAFAQMYPEFQNRNCNLLGLSVDSNPSHLAWLNNIYRSTGIQIPFPVISDLNMKIARKYGMISPNASNTQTVRCVFIIDPDQKIRAKLEYPMKNGRNIGEILRLLEAMQTSDRENVATPANWIPGAPTIIPSPTTYQGLIERINNSANYNCMDWYLCFNLMQENPNYMNNCKDMKCMHNKNCCDNKSCDLNCQTYSQKCDYNNSKDLCSESGNIQCCKYMN